ncbi:unnamed protein product, partial [Ilex paraguariensis]
MTASRNGRFMSTDSNKTDERFKVEEAETVNMAPPPTEKLLVLGGNGFVGSHVCKEALDRGLSVASLSRSGRSSIQESWAGSMAWHQGNLLSDNSWKEAFKGVSSVILVHNSYFLIRCPPLQISCVGGFGSTSYMYKINGTANINAIRAAAEQGVKRFVYISAADFGVANYLLQGYYEGKRAAETELLTKYPYGGIILRPGFIHGTRRVGSMKLPLSVIGSPLEMVNYVLRRFSNMQTTDSGPSCWPTIHTPVKVTAVAKVAVRAATDPVFPPGIIDVYG